MPSQTEKPKRRRLRRLIKCLGCSERRARAEFLIDDYGNCATKYCARCRRLKEQHADTQPDWAYGLLNWLRRIADRRELSAELTTAAIRIIANEQDYKCALTDEALILPAGQLPSRATILTWANRALLTADERLRVPVLVRISHLGVWSINNSVMITRRVHERFHGFRDLLSIQRFCKDLADRNVTAVTADRVYEQMRDFDASAN